MTTLRTVLVDEVPYASPKDVNKFIRNREKFESETTTNPTDPTVEAVHSMLLDRSEFIDNRTNRAWRTRRVEEYAVDVKLSHLQKIPRHRRRSRFSGGETRYRSPNRVADVFADAQLPHLDVRTTADDGLDDSAGDKIVIIAGRSKDEITADAGIEDGDYYIQSSKGRIKIDLGALTISGVSYYGRMLQGDLVLRVSYRYGTDESTAAENYDKSANETDTSTSTYARTAKTPHDIRMATAKLVAADLFMSDSYGNILPATGEESPSPSNAADDLRSEAMDTLNELRRKPKV